jgi:hypothetical protein
MGHRENQSACGASQWVGLKVIVGYKAIVQLIPNSGVVTLSIRTFCITTLSIMSLFVTLSIKPRLPLCWVSLFYCYPECHYGECRYAECLGAPTSTIPTLSTCNLNWFTNRIIILLFLLMNLSLFWFLLDQNLFFHLISIKWDCIISPAGVYDQVLYNTTACSCN